MINQTAAVSVPEASIAALVKIVITASTVIPEAIAGFADQTCLKKKRKLSRNRKRRSQN